MRLLRDQETTGTSSDLRAFPTCWKLEDDTSDIEVAPRHLQATARDGEARCAAPDVWRCRLACQHEGRSLSAPTLAVTRQPQLECGLAAATRSRSDPRAARRHDSES
jgi:hypothetical protein